MAKWWGIWCRHPRTTQERRANQDKHDTLIRGRRRKLPTSYDDIFVHNEKCWKRTRKTQYRPNDCNYTWHEFDYAYGDVSYMTMRNITDHLDEIGCFYEREYLPGQRWIKYRLRWFGPDMGV